jgi:hypothetical protein
LRPDQFIEPDVQVYLCESEDEKRQDQHDEEGDDNPAKGSQQIATMGVEQEILTAGLPGEPSGLPRSWSRRVKW